MKGINEWAKEVKHNKEFAKKFEGVKNVEDILKISQKKMVTLLRRKNLKIVI